MAYTTINKSTDYFNTKLYAGNSGTNNITGVGFQPDFVWIKKRNATADHALFDSIRGVTKRLQSNENSAEATTADSLTSFDSDGFTLGSYSGANQNLLASWNWKAGTTGSGTTTGAGTGKAYSYSVNTTAGFSIVKYKGNATTGHTIPHHLGAVPKFYISKKLNGSGDWYIYNYKSGPTKFIKLNETGGDGTSALWNDTAPTSTVFNLDSNSAANGNDDDYIAYVFAEKTGYSKIGSYTGNGNSNGAFVYTGFKPALVMCKRTDGGTQNWCIMDNKRGYNPDVQQLHPNANNVESLGSGDTLDLLSNGFKMRATDGDKNGNGETFIYMAFGQSIVGSNNVPATAR